MSQVIFSGKAVSGSVVRVQAGWDDPTETHYLVLEDEEGEVLYDSVDDERADEALDLVAYLSGVLDRLLVEPPEGFLERFRARSRNRQHKYTETGWIDG